MWWFPLKTKGGPKELFGISQFGISSGGLVFSRRKDALGAFAGSTQTKRRVPGAESFFHAIRDRLSRRLKAPTGP